jgi:formylmethanofuran dehydrogenase subunit E
VIPQKDYVVRRSALCWCVVSDTSVLASDDTASDLQACVQRLAGLHPRLCPRQVLGVRIGLEAGRLLGVSLPRLDKRLLAVVETDGCFADGVSAATGCWLGRRTLRLLDYGKVAATFIDVRDGRTIRVWPRAGIRDRAWTYAASAPDAWHAYLAAYQVMPVEDLLEWRDLGLSDAAQALQGSDGRVTCARCGEEVLNGRGVVVEGQLVCRLCAGQGSFDPSIPGPQAIAPV